MFAGEPVRPDKAKVGRRTEPAWREGTNKSSATFHLNQWASEVLVNLAPNKVLSADFICSLTQAQLRLLLDTAIKGDGWRGKFLAQMSKERIDPFQMVASLAGLRTSLRKQVNNGKDYWTLNVFAPGHESFTARRNTVRENVVHDGMIWCPTTPTHTWLARRDGHVFFTGNTDQGTTFTFTPTFQEITVEEEYWPIRQSPSGAKLELKFMLAEVTAQNLEISLNDGLGSSLLSGSNGTNGDGSIWVEPPTIGTEVRLMLGWDSLIEGAGSPTPTGPFQRLIVRQAVQTGAVEMQHKKGNAKTMYACTFSGEKPPNLQPFRLIFPAGFAA
jgi:hypothetical protein